MNTAGRRRIVIVGSLVIAAGFLAVLWVRGFSRAVGPSIVETRAKAGEKVFGELAMSQLDTVNKLFSVLDAAPIVSGADLATLDQVSSLKQLVAEFLIVYYQSESPAEYRMWRQRRGDRLLARNESANGLQYGEIYEFLLDADAPPGASSEQLFDEIWRASREFGGGACLADSITVDSRGLMVAFKHLTSTDRRPPVFRGELEPEIWIGGVSSMANNWWHPRTELQTAISRDQQVLGGYFAAVIGFKNGSRRPMIWALYWDRIRSEWQLNAVFISNFFDDRVRPPEI